MKNPLTTHPFLWNFTLAHALSPNPPLTELKTKGKWEVRFFWPDNEPVILHGLGFDFLNVSLYQFKQHDDQYLITSQAKQNLKIRRGVIQHKPLLAQSGEYCHYAKKHVIELSHSETIKRLIPELDGLKTDKDWMNTLNTQGLSKRVTKEAFQYQFAHKTQIELSRLLVDNRYFLSLCIESKSLANTRTMRDLILPQQKGQNYPEFLNSL